MTPRPMRAIAGVTSTLALVAGGLAATAVAAQAVDTPVDTTLCPGTPIRTGALTSGETVTGQTTVEDDQLDSFGGTYKGTIEDPYGNDLYLFKLSGSRITNGVDADDKPAGIWAGISGSPVYDGEGNLVGSVSYSFTGYESSTYAGITPAANIIQADPTQTTSPTFRLKSADQATLKKAGLKATSTSHQARSLTQRVVVGASTDRAAKSAQKSRLLTRTAGPADSSIEAAGRTDLSDVPIEAGGNIATSYSYGQVTYASVGTVTAVCGSKVYAFGHPDENIGPSSQTILKAQTLAIMSDGPESYKLVNLDTDHPAGTLTSDNVNGIQGTLDVVPDSVPVVTHTTANGTTVDRTSHVSAQYAVPAIVANQVGNDAVNAFKKYAAGDAVTTVKVTFTREGSATPETFEHTDRISSADGFADELAYNAAGTVETLLTNGFEDVTITGVDISSTMLPDYRAYVVKGVQYLKGSTWKDVPVTGVPAKAGASISVRAKLAKDVGSSVAPTTTDPVTWKTSGSSKKSGAFTFTGQAASFDDEEFFEDGGDVEEGAPDQGVPIASLDDLLDYLASQPRQDDVLARYRYNTKSGKLEKFRTTRAPGVVSGKVTVRLDYGK